MGIRPLREAVANLYNEMHRKGKESKYTWENVAIVPGGRAGLIRIAAVLGNSYLSFFLPDYTAYNEMLSLFKNFAAIPVPLSEEDGYHIHPDKIAEEIARGTSVILTSNPRNPTGRVVANPELAEIQDICRTRATLISDEFYSGYNYTSNCDGTTISAAENVEDVDEDDVLQSPPFASPRHQPIDRCVEEGPGPYHRITPWRPFTLSILGLHRLDDPQRNHPSSTAQEVLPSHSRLSLRTELPGEYQGRRHELENRVYHGTRPGAPAAHSGYRVELDH